MKWFENHRLEWIREMVLIYGFINREHLTRKFGIGSAQAAIDFAATQRRWPKLMTYNKQAKRYEINEENA